MRGAILAWPTEHRLRFHLGCQSLPTPHIHDRRRNKLPCTPPSMLSVRPISSEVHDQRRSWYLERFHALEAISPPPEPRCKKVSSATTRVHAMTKTAIL